MEDDLRRLLASQTAGVVELDTISIGHPSFTKTYYLVRNLVDGFDGLLEDGVTVVHFEYCPMKWERASSEGDLDYELKITLQDLNEIVAGEVDLIAIDDPETPTVIARSYIYGRDRSVGTIQDGPYVLQVGDIGYVPTGCAFTASAKPLNNSATGTIYSIAEIPMLQGFIL